MKPHVFVTQIMNKKVVTINIEDNLIEAKGIMDKVGIRHLPVMHHDRLVGMLSKTDINRLEYMSDFAQGKVGVGSFFEIFTIEDIMSKEVVTVQTDDSLSHIAGIFSRNNFHAMPVLEGDVLCGIVSVKDVLKHFIQ